MAKIIVDESKCVGCGLCVNNCPDCFELNDEGIGTIAGEPRPDVRRGMFHRPPFS